MQALFRWLIPVIVLVLWGGVLTTGVVVSVFLNNPDRIAALTETIAVQFMRESRGMLHGVSVRADAFGLTAWPLPALKAEGLLVRTADGVSLYVESCELRPVWGKLLSGEFALASLALTAPTLLLDQGHAPETDTGTKPSLDTLVQTLRQVASFAIQVDDGSVQIRYDGRPGMTFSGITGKIALEGTASGAQGECSLDIGRLRWNPAATPAVTPAVARKSNKNAVRFDRIPSESLQLTSMFALVAAGTSIYDTVVPDASESDVESVAIVPESAQADLKTTSATLRGTIELQGDVILNQYATPVEVTLPFQTTHLDGIDLVGVLLRLDGDSGSFNGHVDWSGAEPQVQGRLELGHFSLPRWFGFARELPPGIQAVLNNLSGRLDAQVTPSGIRVSQLEGSAAGMIVTGKGGLARFDKPVVALDMKTSKVNLDVLFPELSGKSVAPPVFDAPPALKLTGTPPAPDDVGYDIRLSAESATVQHFDLQKPTCRIAPATSASGGRTDTGYPSLEMSARGYGGKADASLIMAAKDIALTVRVQDMSLEGLIARFGSGLFGGKLTGSVKVRGRGATLAAFLSELEGTLEARVDNGFLALDRAAQTPFKQILLSFQGAVPKMLKESLTSGKASGGKKPLKEVPFSGKWSFSLEAPHGLAAMRGNGTILFSPTTCLPVRAETFPAHLSGRLKAFDLSLSGTGNLDFNLKEATFGLSEFAGRVDTSSTAGSPGNALFGSIRGTSLKTSPVWDGTVTLETSGVRSFLSRQGLLPDAFPSDALRRLQLSGQFHATDRVIRCTDLDGKLDTTTFSGAIERTQGARPRWKVEVGLGTLDVGKYLPDTKNNTKSTSPWPVAFLKKFDLEGILRIQKCIIAKVDHDSVSIPLQLRNGILTSDPITARVYEGTAGAGFRFDASGDVASARLRYTQSDVNMQLLSQARGLSPLITGREALDIDVSGRVRSGNDIPAALQGSWLFRVVGGDFRTPQGKSSFVFRSISASGVLRNGIVSTKDMLLAGNTISARGQGSINLLTRKLESSFTVSGQSIPDIPVRYYGNIDSPRRSINAAGVIINTLGDIGSGLFNILDGALNVPFRFINP